MPRSGQHDSSPGDARQPYSDRGGPAGRHAETHDVEAEVRSNSTAAEPTEDFDADLVNDPTSGQPGGGHGDESHAASAEKALHEELGLDASELDRVSILETGTTLKQGGTYVDLRDPARQPFTALGGHTAGPGNRYVAKRDADHEIWNRLVGQHREVAVERPQDRHDA